MDIDKATILVVDDTSENIDILSGIFRNKYKVKAALNGEKALKIAQVEPCPSIILLDIMMPGIDGYEVCRQLKNNRITSNIPVIFITAKNQAEDEKVGLELGAVDYITKPFSPSIVEARVHTHLTLHDQSLALEHQVNMRTTELLATRMEIVRMEMDIAKNDEREALQEKFSKQIAEKNVKIAISNQQLETTINDLRSTQQQLNKSQKMAALGRMVQGVAHELNTPIGLSITAISHIQEYSTKLTRGLADDKIRRSDLDNYLDSTNSLSNSIRASLDKAATLIRSFKMVSVEQHQELEQTFNVHSNLADILDSIKPRLAKKNINIINDIPEDINIISFAGVFRQIYTNLINNALLHAFEDKEAGEIQIAACFVDKQLSISFKDNGKGMSEDIVKKVFDPFFTTKRAQGGTGLGMSIIYNLVSEKLSGSISIVSGEGKGTTFNIRVPT